MDKVALGGPGPFGPFRGQLKSQFEIDDPQKIPGKMMETEELKATETSKLVNDVIVSHSHELAPRMTMKAEVLTATENEKMVNDVIIS